MFILYADVLFDLPLKQSYTYQVPTAFSTLIQVGMRVEVTFKNRKQLGIVEKLHSNPSREDLLLIDNLPDTEALVNSEQLQLAYWLADHYLCAVGEALFKMFPKAKRFPKKKPSKSVRRQFKAEYTLTKEQNHVYQKIHIELMARIANTKSESSPSTTAKAKSANPPQVHLLHGITGCGKTEIYIHLLRDALHGNANALLLVPEISLTVQMLERLQRVFGDQLALLHSGLGNAERFRAYAQLLRGEKKIALGTRSAIFAPLRNLALIILDEEHDASFKENSTPRYDARQIALRRAENHQAIFILGSATPRLEATYYSRTSHRTLSATFTYHSLSKRAKGKGLPRVQLVKLASPETMISGTLLAELEHNLARKEQSILLLNRRGYFPQVYAQNSQTVEKCPACTVSLNLHRNAMLICHYCGFQRHYDGKAFDGGPALPLGSGIQKLEDFLLHRFPQARIERLDSDVITRRHVLQQTLLRFLAQEIDILIGTQIIARGLDAPKVSLVGVLQAERGLHLPDFRSAEKTFSLLTQVAGRAGRGELNSRVIFECLNTQDPIIQAAATQDYETFYNTELPIRKIAFYPPFSRLVRLIARGPDQERIRAFMVELTYQLKKHLQAILSIPNEIQILGPASAPIEKIHHKFREHVIIKTIAMKKLRLVLQELIQQDELRPHTEDYLELDFDPVDLM